MFGRYGLYFAWLISCIGVLASLYFSEVLHIQPCNLCWYQRMALFPLSVILGIATYNAAFGAIRYALPLAIVGLCFAVFQVILQEIPGWNPLELCGGGPSCSDKIDIGLGPISIPMISSVGFFTICILLIGTWYKRIKKILNLP